MTRPTGALVRALDTDLLTAALAQRYPGDAILRAAPGQVLAANHAEPGQWAVVCEEGVGWAQSGKDVSLLVNVGLSTTTVELPVETVYAAAREEIDLSTAVRTFGDRLEVNFGIWFEYVTGKRTWEVTA